MSLPVAMVAGEPSGDLLAGLVLGPLRERVPDVAPFGIGGPRMQAHGFRADWPMEKLAVRGYVEALMHLVEIAGIRRALKRSLLASPPAAFVGIDAPDFNLDLEVALRTAWRGQGRPIVHFVSPSIWAWRSGRIRKIARAVDHMLVVFPFEAAIYRDAGIPATYVGHPLADVIPLDIDRASARARLGLDASARVVALLPGSRVSEVAYNAQTFLDAARWLSARHPDVRFVVPMAGASPRKRFQAILSSANADGDAPLQLEIVDGRSHDALAAADAVLVASGTATLETALFKRPMVIAYKVAGLTAMLMRRLGSIPYVGLPNILARDFVVPEFLQEDARPDAIGAALEHQLVDVHNRRRLEERFTALHHELRCDTGRRAADVIARLSGR